MAPRREGEKLIDRIEPGPPLPRPTASTDALLSWFDGLAPLAPDEMPGTWRGSSVPSGHPFDGCLERFGWVGKRILSEEEVFPLLFATRGGRTVAVAPGRLPFGLALRLGLERHRATAALFGVAIGLFATRRPGARLRRIEYRGVVSAAMIYDRLPIVDAFRRIDRDTVLGAMDYRSFEHPFFFRLERYRPRP